MRDVLLRQVLEGQSRKTVSKKKRTKEEMGSKDSSAANSRTNSRTNSRAVSNQGSDDEDDEDDVSVGTSMSVASLDADLFSNGSNEDSEDDGAPEDWKSRLTEKIDEIIDRKRSNVQTREKSYLRYTNILRSHFAQHELRSYSTDLVSTFLRSVKNEDSEKEVCLALRALEVTVMTIQSDDVYDIVSGTLKKSYQDSGSEGIKAAAIHTLGTTAIYGGASDDEISDIMDELLEVIESDGTSVGASDSVDVVVAALQEWGHLAVDAEGLEDKTEEAIEVFREQLESSDASVQISAGHNIALLFEKSYQEDDDDYDSGEDDDEKRERHENHLSELKQYDAARNQYQLVQDISALTKESSKSIAKKDRARVRAVFREILITIENPTRGPGFRTHYGRGGYSALGSGIIVKVYNKGHLVINRWWKLQRLESLRRVLHGGFINHYENNSMIFDSLP
ncbi:IFRD domain-containing protein [Phlyctema vagabunda]|uniref:IFRD domain-containing protein n=1 Tax=Phlyctema vagabunda TaxID=108571 RepID=A0ABR4PBI0_9HELO